MIRGDGGFELVLEGGSGDDGAQLGLFETNDGTADTVCDQWGSIRQSFYVLCVPYVQLTRLLFWRRLEIKPEAGLEAPQNRFGGYVRREG